MAHLPTPLEVCPRFSKALGNINVLVKRDDLTGLAFGGNKTRQLEFVFGEVLRSGADIVVAGAYTQSNWCRQITAAARKFGLDVSLVLAHGVKGPMLQGNLLLDRIMGADVTILNVLDEELRPYLEAKASELRAQGRKPFLISSFELGTQISGRTWLCRDRGRDRSAARRHGKNARLHLRRWFGNVARRSQCAVSRRSACRPG